MEIFSNVNFTECKYKKTTRRNQCLWVTCRIDAGRQEAEMATGNWQTGRGSIQIFEKDIVSVFAGGERCVDSRN